MKQVTQRLRDGRVEVVDVPPPAVPSGGVLVDLRASLLSAGTERSKIETGQKTLIGKARARPDQVRQVVAKARRDGIAETVAAVRARLDAPAPLGYSAAGVVVEVGSEVRGIAPGDRVACAGGEHAVHADVVAVPMNLCAPLPENVDFTAGAFATVGAIALHGVHQSEARVGDCIGVIGLGLVGQLTGQILRAAGCTVVGTDLDAELVGRATATGAADIALERDDAPRMAGQCDCVIITAATRSSDPVELSATLLRDRGRVVVVGDVGMTIPRRPYYEKELEVRLARSYGPGRYDTEYEEHGRDYPIGYVRWTERRNIEAFLQLVAAGKVDVSPLVAHRFPIERAADAYRLLVESERSPLGIILDYEPAPAPAVAQPPVERRRGNADVVSVVGAGSFATRILVPGLQKAGFRLSSVASAAGLSARAAADSFGFVHAVGVNEAVRDPDAGVVAIATRHDSHARLVVAALESGKDVFVEKPPFLTAQERDDVVAARAQSGRTVSVGFNRRYAPLAQELRAHVGGISPLQILYRVNAEALEADHWLHDPQVGGGRLLGEGCHFVDFACWLVGALPATVSCTVRPRTDEAIAGADAFSIVLGYADASTATIVYGAFGSERAGKEYVEVHGGGRTGILRDFRVLELLDGGAASTRSSRASEKGHVEQFAALRRVLGGQEEPSSPDPLATMAVTLAALRAAETGRVVSFGSSDKRTSTIRSDA